MPRTIGRLLDISQQLAWLLETLLEIAVASHIVYLPGRAFSTTLADVYSKDVLAE